MDVFVYIIHGPYQWRILLDSLDAYEKLVILLISSLKLSKLGKLQINWSIQPLKYWEQQDQRISLIPRLQRKSQISNLSPVIAIKNRLSLIADHFLPITDHLTPITNNRISRKSSDQSHISFEHLFSSNIQESAFLELCSSAAS